MASPRCSTALRARRRSSSSSHSDEATPTTGMPSRSRIARRWSAGSSLRDARSPDAPNRTKASARRLSEAPPWRLMRDAGPWPLLDGPVAEALHRPLEHLRGLGPRDEQLLVEDPRRDPADAEVEGSGGRGPDVLAVRELLQRRADLLRVEACRGADLHQRLRVPDVATLRRVGGDV